MLFCFSFRMPPESDSAPHSKRHNTFLGCIGNIQFACDGTLTHNNDPVAHRQEFLHFGRNHNNGFPLGNQFIDQVVNLTFCANINASRRLVKDQNIAIAQKPLGNCYFCWFPPDRFITSCFTDGVFTITRSAISAATRISSFSFTTPWDVNFSQFGMAILSATDSFRASPNALRSSDI